MSENKNRKPSNPARVAYEARLGISPDTDEEVKPISGYLVNRSQDIKRRQMLGLGESGDITNPVEVPEGDPYGGNLDTQGEIEIILKPGVAARTSYVRGDALSTGGRAVAMNSDNEEDILDAIIRDDGPNAKKNMARSILGLLKASIDDDYSGVTAKPDSKNRLTPVGKKDPSAEERENESFEAMILGGFSVEDVEGVHFPYSKIKKMAVGEDISDYVNNNLIASRLKRLNNNSESARALSSLPSPEEMATESMVALREYRAIKKIRKTYQDAGIGYVKISHPSGKNIEEPKFYDETAPPLSDVETVLKSKIVKEIDAEISQVLKKQDTKKKGQ